MNYDEAIAYIHGIPKFVRPLGNERLEALLSELGNPQKALEFIHLAGTNGKGSTAAMIASILKEQGYKTGLFTSPFIEVFNERIQINNVNIENDKLSEYTTRVRRAMERSDSQVSEFAFITAVAFLYFYESKCDFVVLETGMGGRLDATNVITRSIVSAITSISLDHTQFLGDTIEEIAYEKCGIIKENGTVVTYPNDSVMQIIEECAKKNHARLIKAKTAVKTESGLVYDGHEYSLALRGEYQAENAAVALEIIAAMRQLGVEISDEAIRKGLENVSWPARFEFIRENIIIDGGHNADGIRKLKESLNALGRPVVFVTAMMEDKSWRECIAGITLGAKYVIATQLEMERCLKADELLKYSSADGEISESVEPALKRAIEIADKDDVICVCGSLYLAGEARSLLKRV